MKIVYTNKINTVLMEKIFFKRGLDLLEISLYVASL